MIYRCLKKPPINDRQGRLWEERWVVRKEGIRDLVMEASITASATLHPLRLSQWSSRRTERRGRYLDGSQNGGKQRVGLLPEKPLCCGRSVRPGAEKVVNDGETLPLAGQVQPSKLMVTQ